MLSRYSQNVAHTAAPATWELTHLIQESLASFIRETESKTCHDRLMYARTLIKLAVYLPTCNNKVQP